MTHSPQNPYESYIVEASAGTGKTYQLSRRFLFLVGAGAAPGNILTITFTVKAAGEMRARILEEAARLLCDQELQREFEKVLADFYKTAVQTNSYNGFDPRPPRTATETAKEILSSTQLLKISTIDSLFNQWVAKFPWESGIDDHGQNQMPTPFRIMDSLTKTDIDRLAWNDVFGKFDESSVNSLDILDHYEENPAGPYAVIRKLEQLDRQNSFLWKLRQESEAEVYHHPTPSETGVPTAADEGELVRSLLAPLAACAAVTGNPEEILAAIDESSLAALIACKIITKHEMKISGIKIRGKKRDALASEIACIESAIGSFLNDAKLTALNKAGLALYQIYVDWTTAREARKSADKIIEFGDLSKGAYRLFNRPDGLGATWLIQKSVRHLMIDEFQDTSLLQWSIFKKLSEELLSGQYNCDEGGVGSSVFIVGDAKQSIYGFREGDPIVLEKARTTFREFGKREIPLDRSFRTAQIILDFVNAYFADNTIAEFRRHETAASANAEPHVPNCGGVLMRELFVSDGDESTKAVEKEAAFLAATFKDALANPEKFPVYDKKTRKFRPLQRSDCCILYRSSTNVAVFEDALRTAGLPCKKAEQKGFFDRQEVQDLVALMTYLARPADSLALIIFLKSPMAMLSDQRVLELIQKARECTDGSLLSAKILAILQDEEAAIFARLGRISRAGDQQLPHELIISIYREFDALARYQDCFADAEGDLARSNLFKLVELCCDFEDQGYASLPSCLHRMKKMASKDEFGSALTANNAITLMTVHKSKGLEFPLVAVIEIGSDWFQVDQYWLKTDTRESGIAYIGTKDSQPNQDENFAEVLATQTGQLRAEAQRLLYVALTRASHYLVITGSQPGVRGKESFFPRLWKSLESLPGSERSDSSMAVATAENFRCTAEEKTAAPLQFSDYSQLAALKSPIPVEITLVQPSRHQESQTEGGVARHAISADPHHLAPLLGNVIHRFFEQGFRAGAIDYAAIWQEEFLLKLKGEVATQLDLEALFARSKEEYLACIAAGAWRRLFENVQRCTPELEIVQLLPRQLVRGSMDLLIEYSDGSLRILDYKTSQYTTPISKDAYNREEDLLRFCRERGYDRQLRIYGRGIRSLYPHAKIDFGVWLTKELAWVPLGQM